MVGGMGVFLALACAAAGCASAASWPRVISPADVRARPAAQGEWVEDYDTALATIAAVMRRELGLPDVPASLYFYRDGDAFRGALLAQGYDEQLAADAAGTLTAIGGFRRILLNDAALRDLEWPYRIALLAHELTHTVQYEVGGGTRGTSEQWLREGFAEWVEVQVLAALGFTTPAQARSIAVRRVRAARVLPVLGDMVTFPDWVRTGLRVGTDATYAQAMLAVELLVERRGVEAMLGYFRLFADSQDRLGNFRRAFGEDLSSFEAVLRAHLQR
jgi:hypothetical protein